MAPASQGDRGGAQSLHQRYQALLEPLSVNLCRSLRHAYRRCIWRDSLAGDDSVQHRRVFEGLRAAGIGVQLHYTPVHLQPDYRRLGFALVISLKPRLMPVRPSACRFARLKRRGARAGGGCPGGIALSAMTFCSFMGIKPVPPCRACSCGRGHRLVGMGIGPATETLPQGVTYVQYGLTRGNTPGLHEWILELDSKFIRAEACAKAAAQLRDQGFQPELICAHQAGERRCFCRRLAEGALALLSGVLLPRSRR